MQPRSIGILGHGAIGRSLVAALVQAPVPGHQLTAVMVRPHQQADARASVPPGVAVVTGLPALLALAPGGVVEAAGQAAVVAHGVQVLASGTPLLVLSVGALADAALHAALEQAARQGGTRLVLPVGAIAGLDGLMALRQAGLQRVRYTSTKPPLAWLGTPAQDRFDLAALRQRTVVFEGTARAAALGFPKNANLAAAVALAGLGLDATTVQLVADPAATGNTGQIDAEGPASRLQVTVSGASTAANPKTSGIVAYSVLACLANQAAVIAFG
ncbi:MAG: aspartate dehydrogenase [Aquabacterium sp.]|nr:aspartate dehydrogenase [Aquabacterium sp.]